MWGEWALMVSLETQVVDQGLFYTAKRFQPITNAEPQDTRRASLRKTSEAIKRHVEGRDANRIAERAANTLFERIVDVAKEMQCQVHPFGTHPRDFRVSREILTQSRRDATDLRACRLIDIAGEK
jgi:hypothetical protein